MSANLAAGKGAAARTQFMYLDCPCWSLLVSSYSVHLIDRKKIRPFPQLAKAQRKYLAGISKSRMALRNCSLNLKHFDQDGYCFIS